MTPKELNEIGTRLFAKRQPFISLQQEIAENFYVERADFTVSRSLGETFADNLSTSYPILTRRDLGNAIGSMLRPSGQEWFHTGVLYDEIDDNDERRWLEWATETQRRAMYDRSATFVRATKEADHDYASFGQNVVSVQLNRRANGLLYRCWHIRDVAWFENDEGKIGGVFRKWKPTARDLFRQFKDRVHPKVREQAVGGSGKDPFREFNCVHMVVEADMADGKFMQPYVSIYYDIENDHVIEMVGSWTLIYNVARWQTVSGSQYAYSPATVAALPEARLLQAMTLTLLEAGEKYVNPPMIGVEEALRTDLNIFAGGFTGVDARYDERLGEVLRPLTQDKSGMPVGFEMKSDSRAIISDCFFLNKLSMPARGPEMTAYEVGQRVQQYIRDAMPLFEPMEMDYNGGICEMTFETMLRAGGFGSPDSMPRRLRGKEIQFKFESPLHDSIERQKVSTFMEGRAMLAEAIALDPSTRGMVDAKQALRDGLNAIRFPAKWVRSEAAVREIEDADRAAAQTQQLLQTMQQGADVAATVTEAGANAQQAAVAAAA